MKREAIIKDRLEEIIRKDGLDWADWNRLMDEIEIYFDLSDPPKDNIAIQRKDALTNLCDTMDEFGVDVDNDDLNAHYIKLCKYTLLFL
jgi:hypothetical protein